MKQHGMDKKAATKAVKNAIKRIQNNPMPQPITKAAARGG
jgi:hypothetical protein